MKEQGVVGNALNLSCGSVNKKRSRQYLIIPRTNFKRQIVEDRPFIVIDPYQLAQCPSLRHVTGNSVVLLLQTGKSRQIGRSLVPHLQY